jgi:hypothetical protein
MRASSALVAITLGCMTVHAREGDPPPKEEAQLATARSLAIDYRKCAAVVLSEQIAQLTKSDTAYIWIMGEDPDSATLTSLRRAHAHTVSGSRAPQMANVPQTHIWIFSFGDLHSVSSEEYAAKTAFRCGSLCGEAREYRLRKNGDSCAVISSSILWQS